MSAFFLTILNMSISTGWIVLAVLLLRLIFRKAPEWTGNGGNMGYLHGVVAVINGDDHSLFLPKVILYLHYSSVV